MFKLNPALRDFWADPRPYKLLKGGRFSSKTQDAAGFAIYLARNYRVKFLCLRQFQNRIGDSVYSILKKKIYQAGWDDEFDIGVSSIRHKTTGSEFLFYGIARNIEEIKGTEDIDLCWIEEGEGLTEDQWAIIDPTIRNEGSNIWVIWNPRLKTDFVQEKLPRLLGEDAVTRHINYDENPFLPKTALKKAERLKIADPESYAHIYLGQSISDDEAAFIKHGFLESCVDAHIKLGIEPTGKNRVGFDIADDGGDKNATITTRGVVTVDAQQWDGLEDKILQSCSRAYNTARDNNAIIHYDCIGVGAAAGSHFANLKGGVEYYKFNAADAVMNPNDEYITGYLADDGSWVKGVTNKEKFENLKAQSWAHVADRVRKTHFAVQNGTPIDPSDVISISSECPHKDQLLLELSTPRRDYSNSGKDKVESKKDLAKRKVKSPNLADAFIMAYSPIDATRGSFGILIKSKYRK